MEITRELIEKGEITLYRGDVDSIRVIEAHNMHMSDCQAKMKQAKEIKWVLLGWNLFMGVSLGLFKWMSFEIKDAIVIAALVNIILIGMWYTVIKPLQREAGYPDFKRICITYDDWNPYNKDYSNMLYGEVASGENEA